MRSIILTVAALSVAAISAGCSQNPGLTTASVAPKPVPTAAFDPQCTTLRARIAEVEAEGTVGRVVKAADGKTRSVTIKRASLSKVGELNRLNADYRTRCSNPAIKTSTAVTAAQTVKQAATAATNPVVAAAIKNPKAAAKLAANAAQ
ncbi:MAG: hypothetical protein AAFR23_08640 [Pseudomonadota bacterium]